MKILATLLLLLFVRPDHSLGQLPSEVDATHSIRAQTAAGATLVHFGLVDDGVYKGSRPKTNADFEFLQSRNVKYIVDLQFLPFLHWSEQKKAKRYGIRFIPARMNASIVSPSQKHVEAILAILRDKRNQPVYFHCALGRDRTSLVAALYKMYFLGMSPQDAWLYMHESGYKDGWVRSGLARYLQKHPAPSAEFMALEMRNREHI